MDAEGDGSALKTNSEIVIINKITNKITNARIRKSTFSFATLLALREGNWSAQWENFATK